MASLLGRFIRTVTLFVALIAVFAAAPAQAAPFAAIVMDARTGETLWEKNANARLHPASLTKMMTLYIAFQEIESGRMSLDTVVTVSKHAAAQPPSRLGLKPGQKIKLRYLIRAAAIKSANDAATAIGEAIGGTEAAFAKRMTKTARALGMGNTTFRNANGLTAEGHLSSARDMTVLGRHLFYDFPQYYNIFSRRTADAGIAQVNNTNTRFLDAYEGADGIKTGYTVAAGFNLTASAKRGDKRIIATIFGGASTPARNAKMRELMDMGFDLAKNGKKVAKPEPAPVTNDLLIADAVEEAVTGIDVPGAEGGAGKTIRVSGEVIRSIRPKARPGAAPAAEPAHDPVALAIASGVADALAEANAAPPPEGTLEAQAVAMAAGESTEEPEEEIVVAAAPEAAPAPGSLEAQAAALAAGAAPAVAPAPNSLEAQAVALAEAAPEAAAVPAVDAALAAVRPVARPAGLVAAPAPAPVEVAVAEPVQETVAPVAKAVPVEVPAEKPVALAMAEPAPMPETIPDVTAIETVAADANAPMPESVLAPATRKAPIFDTVEMAEAVPEPEGETLVVVSKSTSGGAQWGVNVGGYSSRGEAERALLKTGLSESATLDGGLRKVTERSGKYRATFLGLSEDQAALACRRIRARGVECETTGPTG